MIEINTTHYLCHFGYQLWLQNFTKYETRRMMAEQLFAQLMGWA